MDLFENDQKLFVLDAMNLAYRFFHTPGGGCVPETALKSDSGELTGIVYGVARLIQSIYYKEFPTHMAVALDSPKSTRRDLYPEYKQNRNERPSALNSQIPLLLEFLEAIGVPSIQVEGEEADDVAGSLAVMAREANMQAMIVSGDKDFLQLVGNGVYVYTHNPKTNSYSVQAEAESLRRFGVAPEKVIDVLALMGDTADNVPGVKGIGPKGAVKLIEQFGSIFGVYERLDEIGGALRQKLEASREMAFVSYNLVTIKTNILPKEGLLDKLRLNGDPLASPSARAMLERLSIKSL